MEDHGPGWAPGRRQGHSPWVTECSSNVCGMGTSRLGTVDCHTLDLNSVFTMVDLPSPLCPKMQNTVATVCWLGYVSQTICICVNVCVSVHVCESVCV